MKLKSYFKYLLRFLLLQVTLTALTIYYFDNFLISNQEFKEKIYLNLVSDVNRFLPFINNEGTKIITIDGFFAILIFLFLIILYSTKFYTYVNELSFSINKNYLDEYFQLYLLWTSYMFAVFFSFRFENVSRGNLLLFSFLVPLVLLIFRNTEFLSSILGRSVTDENYVTFNLDENSNFRNLRLLTFRKNFGSKKLNNLDKSDNLINEIDKINKIDKVNLIIINFGVAKKINNQIENYLIELNKKILIISDEEITFGNNFIYRKEIVDGKHLVYFNNDVQYGSKFILKRIIDIFLSIVGLILLLPIFTFVALFIIVLDGFPFLIKQK